MKKHRISIKRIIAGLLAFLMIFTTEDMSNFRFAFAETNDATELKVNGDTINGSRIEVEYGQPITFSASKDGYELHSVSYMDNINPSGYDDGSWSSEATGGGKIQWTKNGDSFETYALLNVGEYKLKAKYMSAEDSHTDSYEALDAILVVNSAEIAAPTNVQISESAE